MFITRPKPFAEDKPAPVRGTPLMVIIAAWSVPVMIVGQFAWLATLPVALVLVGALRDTRLRALRLPALVLAASYALPYLIWKTRPDPAPSLSRDIHPGLAGLVVVAAVLVIVVFHSARRRAAATS